jgi:hypothetical protein
MCARELGISAFQATQQMVDRVSAALIEYEREGFGTVTQAELLLRDVLPEVLGLAPRNSNTHR